MLKATQKDNNHRSFICLTALLVVAFGLGIWGFTHADSVFGKDQWTVTQYGPRDINSSFYTIYNPKRGLIVVDGGWTEDAPYVASVIKKLGGKVNAWILTHPHQDHIGAFNALWNDHKGITIKDIYTVEMASPEDCQEAAWWDSMDAYRDFLSLNIPDLHYVHAGDHLSLCSLPIEILSAFDEDVRERSKDFLNDGSMMFKVTGPEKTFLFCADVGKSMSKFLCKKYDEALKSDFVQMGHHGNGGLKENFYTIVSPSAAFFDAPDWLMYDETGTYNTPAKIELMQSLGAQILSFNSAPNSVTI